MFFLKLLRAAIVVVACFTLTPLGSFVLAWVLTGFNNKRSVVGNVTYCLLSPFCSQKTLNEI